MIAIRITGLSIVDPVIALGVALFILKTGYEVMRKSFGGLLDASLPQAEEDEIRLCIANHGCQVAGFHNLRTRKAGRHRYVELHLVMPKSASVEATHRICDHMEQDRAALRRDRLWRRRV